MQELFCERVPFVTWGLSTHNPEVALEAVRRGVVEVIMFSITPFGSAAAIGGRERPVWRLRECRGADRAPEGGALQSLRGK